MRLDQIAKHTARAYAKATPATRPAAEQLHLLTLFLLAQKVR